MEGIRSERGGRQTAVEREVVDAEPARIATTTGEAPLIEVLADPLDEVPGWCRHRPEI